MNVFCSQLTALRGLSNCIFTVTLNKGPRGVGLSLSGGVDSSASYPGLIRIKRIFPHQAAWATGKLQPGDILLEVNGWPLTGLTNFQALMVLRGAWDEITLTVARPKGDQHLQLSPQTEPPKPPLRVTLSSEYFPRPQPEVAQESPVSLSGVSPPLSPTSLVKLAAKHQHRFPLQEFEIVLTKQQGSLGFTLSDESVHGHYVRMLMREPALTDGRIRPGDRILEVNHVPISSMTHSEAVLFLRRAADVVLLRLYRDPTQPLQSPADTDSISSSRPGSADRCTRPKACLRPEARSLLSALAATRQQQCQQQHAAEHSDPAAKSEDANSRRLRRAGLPSHRRPHAANSGGNYPDSCSDAASNASQDDERYYSDWELDYLLAEESGSGEQLLGDGDTGKATTGVPLSRPTFLDLDASIGGGGDALSSPNQRQLASDGDRGEAAEPGRDFTSLPCETFLVACKTDRDLQAGEDAYTDAIYVQHFARKSPLYSSVNVPASSGPSELVDAVQQGGKQSLLKWYGASMLDGAEDGLQPSHEPSRAQSVTPDLTAASETPSCSLAATRSTTPTTEIELCEHYAALALGRDTEGCEIYTADLHKGWNSRLGFSLKSEQDGSGRARTVISAIHPDSVASRNGRLRIGDVLLSVNEDSVESMPTAQVIELLRNARGSIFLVLMRPAGGGEGDPAAGKLKPTPEEPEDELDLEDAFRMVEELNRTLPEGASEGVVDGLE
ncbi:AGAP000292-PA-like protein [Anopheles sinensis]|uniref:AGAP000292-PA-like protein n=1 Tax=Anopheles sinensis TaxID=74873 RepID=A0A084WPM8_ANOSI|nr:AGAP000292-PA-like protein [Anopheles sinensis]